MSTLGTTHSNGGVWDRSRTLFLDWSLIESSIGPSAPAAESDTDTPRRHRLVTTVADEVKPLRKNVRDSDRAVLTWLASVTQHDASSRLEDVLDHCLRPFT